MKLFVLALFSLIIAVSSESEKPKTTPVKDQKPDNSAFLQKFLQPRPLQYNVNQRYGSRGQEYGNDAILRLRNEGLLDGYNRYYDYVDDDEEYYQKDDRRAKSQNGAPYNVPNIWGYSRNGGLGSLVSQSYNGDPNVWGYLRNNEGRLRNEEERLRYNDKLEGDYELRRNEYPRNQGRPRNNNLDRVYQNLNDYLEPEYIGYIGLVAPGKGIKERYYYRLIGRKGLGFDERTANSYGLTAPITPALLRVVGRGNYINRNNYQYRAGYDARQI